MAGMKRSDLPSYKDMLWPTLKAVEEMGGSATISELEEKVAEIMRLSEEQLEVPHTQGNRSAFEYRLAWSRTHLKFANALTNSSRGVWTITDTGRRTTNDQEIRDLVAAAKDERRRMREARKQETLDVEPEDDELIGEEAQVASSWKDDLLAVLRDMEPSAFERLCQRLLRESGFTEVEVLGRSGDGGLDGSGILKIGLLSFHVFFQCKRYAGAVSSPNIRDFRGATIGRGDKGLFITTGRFTADARREAIRDGAPPIDLIDGDELCELLCKLELGVQTEMVPSVSVDQEFFTSFSWAKPSHHLPVTSRQRHRNATRIG